MTGAPPHVTLTRSGGPGDGLDANPPAIRLGFCAEPIVDLVHFDATALYSECLARMMVAESVLLKASDFVGDLEARGDIGLLDAAMVDLVLDVLADEPYTHLGCNVSPKTLADANAWRWLLYRIESRAWLASRLTLEITESSPLNEIAGAAERLGEAKRLGCRLAIDDFGAGFAAPAYLLGIEVAWDMIKIDRHCFGDLRKTPSARDGLHALVGRAACFAPIVVVEGIETKEHLAAARAAGARFGQGRMFDGPVCDRWNVPDEATGARLTAALLTHGAVLRPSPEAAVGIQAGHSFHLSRVDRLGDRVRALVGRAWMGGTR